jgi:hypothetical protein
MPINYSFSRLERAYLQVQPLFGIIPNTSGTATLGNSNACRFIRMDLNNEVALLERPDKTGTRSMEQMTGGRKIGRWSIEMSVAGNGTAGVAPDCDPILQAAFGQTAAVGSGTATIATATDTTPIVVNCSGAHGIASGAFEIVNVAGVAVETNANGAWLAYASSTTALTLCGSVATGNGAGSGGTMSRVKLTYTFLDGVNQFTLWSFRTPADLDQRVGNNCLVQEMTFNLNQDVATWQANGDCFWVLRSDYMSQADNYQLGSLTTYPTEPSAPVTNGTIIPGFTGRFVAWQSVASSSAAAFAANAWTFTTIRNVSIRIGTANMMVRDTFGSFYSTTVEADVRTITVNFSIYDDDEPQTQQLKAWGDNKTPVDFVINLGTVPGNTWIQYMKNVYLATSVMGDGQLRFDATYADSRATTTSLAVRDEYSLTII